MWQVVKDLQKPLGPILAAFVVLWPGMPRAVTLDFPQDGTRLEVITEAAADADLQVHPAKGAPLMGRTERKAGRLIFVPALPFLAGQPYAVEWTDQGGQRQRAEFKILPAKSSAPTVRLEPRGLPFPANALKFYLHFSTPMEQGVFLDRLRLTDGGGREVIGPFRETELWSPDGKRLTVWFHPGRQKAGVNLNLDEGPVLHPDTRYTLTVAGSWRSSAGIPMGQDKRLEFATVAADHECPKMTEWDLAAPKAGSGEPLKVRFPEGLDSAMLKTALRVRLSGATADLTGTAEPDPSGAAWAFVPAEPWREGDYELMAAPDLEDLAGNSLIKPFEVDLGASASQQAATTRRFTVK